MKKVFGFKAFPEKHEPFGLKLILLLLAFALGSLSSRGDTGLPFVVDAAAGTPLQYLPIGGTASTTLTASVTNTFALNVSGTYNYAWTQLQDSQNPYAVNATGSGKSVITGSNSSSASASMPVAGVYEYQVVVTDAKNPALAVERRVWVRVWDSKPAFGSDPLMVAPGCAAPTTVTTIHSDPGPYQHPRILCTPADQAAMHARVTGGSLVATAALKSLISLSLTKVLNSTITADLVSYMGMTSDQLSTNPYSGPYKGSPKTLQTDIANDNYIDYYNQLWYAGYVAWVDPADAGVNLQAVANLSAALAHYHLLQVYNAGAGSMPGTFNTSSPDYINGLDQIGNPCDDLSGLALAYDFSYGKMSTAQQEDVRRLLFAAGYNRTTSTIYFRGTNENGDFSNEGENHVMVANAIAGEEGTVQAVDPGLYDQFSTPPPAGSKNPAPWMSVPQAGPLPTDPKAFPYSTGAGQGDVQRELWWSIDNYVSAWGWSTDREAYYGLSALYLYPAYMTLAIHGAENQFVTNQAFDTKQMIIWELYGEDKPNTITNLPGLPAGSTYSVNDALYDHHDSLGFDYRQYHVVFLKYMFPNDLAIDYWYQQNLPGAFFQGGQSVNFPIVYAMFGLDPIGLKTGNLTTLPQVGATAEQGKLIQVDPQAGATVIRSGWTENDAELYFDTTWQPAGHLHSEQNGFSFFANGRAWAFTGGRHVTVSDAQAAVLYQDPNFASDPATHGYRGESLSSATMNTPGYECFPPTPGHLLNVTEDPNHVFATVMGDSTFGYLYGHSKQVTLTGALGRNLASFMPTGFFGYYRSLFTGESANTPSQDHDFDNTFTNDIGYSNISQIRPTFFEAKRSIIFVRKPNPYALIVDDFNADGAPHNYRWTFNSAEAFAQGQSNLCIDANGKQAAASVTLVPGSATNTQAIFYHPVDLNGGARLLVKDCTESIPGMATDPITLEAKDNFQYSSDLNYVNPDTSPSGNVPLPPLGVTSAVQSNGTSVLLSWTNQSGQYGATSNVIAYRVVNTTQPQYPQQYVPNPWMTYATITAPAPKTLATELVTGLNAQTLANPGYQFEVYATNAAGASITGSTAPGGAGQAANFTVTDYLTDGGVPGADNTAYITTNRVFIDHNNVIKPQYKVLLLPYTTDNPVTAATTTTVNGNITTITITPENPTTKAVVGPTDTITLDATQLKSNPAQYISFSRASSTAKAPTLQLPPNPNLSVAAGAPVNYSGITATSSTGVPLTVTYSVPNGTTFASGVTTVTASALDPATGLESSQTFTVTTAAAAPVASIQSIYNADATLADNGITLGWPPVLGATSYNVYRATSSGGTYSLVQGHIPPCVPNSSSGSILTIFNDRNLSGTNYFYHVTAVVTDTSGIDHEGLPSNVVALTQPVPSGLGLTVQGVGGKTSSNPDPNSGVGFAPITTTPFSFLLSQSNQINKSGYGFPNYYDEAYNFLGKTWTGDGTFTVRVTGEYENYGSATNPNQYNNPYYGSAYGLVFRDNAPTTDPGTAAEAGILYQENLGHSNSVSAYSRPIIPNGPFVADKQTLLVQSQILPPVWVRLTRVGSVFTTSYSTDGQTWNSGSTSTVAMSATTQVGVNMASSGSTAQDNGTFDNLVFLSPPTIVPGNGSLALNWSQSTGATSYSLARSTSPTGPFSPIAQATNITSTSFTDTGLTNLTTYYYQLTATDSTGSVSSVNPVSGIPAVVGTPILTETPGNGLATVFWSPIAGATSYKIYQSSSPTSGPYTTAATAGSSYTATGLTNGVPVYFFVVASNASGSGADSAVIGSVPVRWTDQNVGTVNTLGSYTADHGRLTVTGSGADVTGSSDNFNYLSRPWTGDGTFIAHLASITTTDTGPNASAKIGVMFRANPATGTNVQNEFLLDTLNSSALQSRTTTGGNTNSTGEPGAPPNWLRLERTGANFTAYTSVDEINWLPTGSSPVTNSITDPGLIGLAVNARNNAAVATAVFDATAFLVIPQSLSTSDVEGTHANINWSLNSKGNVTDATALQLEISPAGANTWSVVSSKIAPLSGSYEVMNLSTSTSYDFRIKELAGSISGDYATPSNFTTKAADLPPAPTNLTGTAAGTSVMLSWTNPQTTNATGISVAYRQTGATSWITYASNLATTTQTKTVESLTEGQTYNFEVYATNAGGASYNPPVVTITVPVPQTFAKWASSYGLSGANAAPSASAASDGVSNSLKYLIGVDPTTSITTSARSNLPILGTVTQNGNDYLTLTYRKSAADQGITVTLQTSTDLVKWNSETTPDYIAKVGNDPVTQDPIYQIGAKINGNKRLFIRLDLNTP